jgi:tRNA(Ile)-lysidine synthase
LNRIKNDFQLDLTLGYFNHNLRGKESEEEVRFIKRFSETHKIELKVGTDNVLENSNVKKISIQESARELRYGFFEKLDREYNFDKIVTGHHKDDQTETVLMRFLQGNDISGMRGIPLVRDKFIRPLLWAERQEIERYAAERKIKHFEDSSNKKTDYLRNKIRHEVLPYLREILGTNIDLILQKHGDRFQYYDEIINYYTEKALNSLILRQEKDKIILDINSFKDYFTLLQQKVVAECVKRINNTDKPVGISDVEKVIGFINGTLKKKTLYIFTDTLVYKDRKNLYICVVKESDFEKNVEPGRKYEFDSEGFSFESHILGDVANVGSNSSLYNDKRGFDELVSMESLKGSLRIRYWNYGDSFRPLGMKYKKKISDFFIDLKIRPDMKKRIPILSDEEKIVWVCGIRIDDRVKLTEKTRQVIGLRYRQI